MSTCLVALGLVLEVTGGPVLQVWGLAVSLRGGTRVLLAATVVIGLRHLLVPRPTLLARWRAAWRRVPDTPFFRTVLPTFLVTRVAVLLVGYTAVLTIGFSSTQVGRFQVSTDPLADLMSRWDAGWYADIATHGYRAAPGPDGQTNIAFFPAYPLLVRGVSRLTGAPVMLAGLLISLAAFLGALSYFLALGRRLLAEGAAATALALLAGYPFAVFYGAVYTESLFLLCTLGAIYHLWRRDHVLAAVWAFGAGLVRPNGCLLSLTLLAVAVQPWAAERTGSRYRWLWTGTRGAVPTAPPRQPLRACVAAVMPVVGMLVFSLYVLTLTGSPFAWADAHRAWGRSFQGLSGLTGGPLRQLVEFGFMGALRSMPLDTLNALAAGFAGVAVWPVLRRFGVPLASFVAVNLLVPLTAGGVMSMGRLTAVLFPVFLWLGDAIPERQRPQWLLVFGLGQALVATLFFTWRQIF